LTVGKASRGLANYINSISKAPKLAISYDSRNNSDVFAKRAASIFAGAGIKVYIWKELMPTPALSFAVRELGCDGGIMVTASHNPAKYNGYKVYGADGCQIANEAADRILDEINSVYAGVMELTKKEAFSDRNMYSSSISHGFQILSKGRTTNTILIDLEKCECRWIDMNMPVSENFSSNNYLNQMDIAHLEDVLKYFVNKKY